MTNALYAGSFDPMTRGHLDVIRRASKVFDKLYVGILINYAKTPRPLGEGMETPAFLWKR